MPGLFILQGCSTVQLTKGKIALIDQSDAEMTSKIKWYACETNAGYFYAACHGGNCHSSKIHVFMHRYLMGEPTGMKVDHRNGDSMDCRRENLRICTQSQNVRNRRKVRGSSKYKGVHFQATRNKWAVQISENGKSQHVGLFSDEREAAKAYDRRAKDAFGEFAHTNAMIFGEDEFS